MYSILLNDAELAAIMAGTPCSDGAHFPLPPMMPGAFSSFDALFETTPEFAEPHLPPQGHKTCTYPRKMVVMDEKTGAFAVVHQRAQLHGGYALQTPTTASRTLVNRWLEKKRQARMLAIARSDAIAQDRAMLAAAARMEALTLNANHETKSQTGRPLKKGGPAILNASGMQPRAQLASNPVKSAENAHVGYRVPSVSSEGSTAEKVDDGEWEVVDEAKFEDDFVLVL